MMCDWVLIAKRITSSYYKSFVSVRKTISASKLRNVSSCEKRWSIQFLMCGMAGGKEPRLICNPYRTSRYVMTLRRVYMMSFYRRHIQNITYSSAPLTKKGQARGLFP